jgi:glucose-6-phosphate-specific signal transduction histidine kinase
MASQSVQADIAVPFGLSVRMRSAALADLLEDLLAAAIHSAPASRLLMTAATHGDYVHIGITDDMPGADPAVRQGSVRGLMERVALRGGALDINVRVNEGTTMTLRLAAAGEKGKTPFESVVKASVSTSGVAVQAAR